MRALGGSQTTVPDAAQKIIACFALFADGKTVTRAVDSV
jgi:hypothetical protein